MAPAYVRKRRVYRGFSPRPITRGPPLSDLCPLVETDGDVSGQKPPGVAVCTSSAAGSVALLLNLL